MTEVNLNPTVDGYRGSIGRLVFKRYKGRTIVAKKPVRTTGPSESELAQQERFREAVAYAKSVLADEGARAFYEPIAVQRDLSVYSLALGDYLKVPTIKPLDLTNYHGKVGDTIVIRATDDIGLADLDVEISAQSGTLIERGKAVEIGAGSGKWVYTATVQVSPGSDVFIEVNGVDHAGNKAFLTENPTVGADDE
jgi:hypothetical protein